MNKTNVNSGKLLTKRESHLQNGKVGYKMGFSFAKWDSWFTNGILVLLFTLRHAGVLFLLSL